MKRNLLILFLLIFNLVKAQTVGFFGEALSRNKLNALYYRFDNEAFSTAHVTPIELNLPYGDKFKNSYRIDFDEKVLRKYKYLYFSGTTTVNTDSALVRQNRINLVELFLSLDAMPSKPENVNISNDLLLEDNFDKVTTFARKPTIDETKYIGEYTVPSNFSAGTAEITLDSSKVYHAKHPKETFTNFLMDEEIGYWDLSDQRAGPNRQTIRIRYLCRFNKRIGNKTLPIDGNINIVIRGDRLLYPTGFESMNELKRK